MRVFRGITTEWLILSCGVVVTPGHFLNEFASFERIDELVARGGFIVMEDGTRGAVTAERAKRVICSKRPKRRFSKRMVASPMRPQFGPGLVGGPTTSRLNGSTPTLRAACGA